LKHCNGASRRERKGLMRSDEIVSALRALADRIAGAQAQRAPEASKVGDDILNGVVQFWDVKTSKSGKPYGSLKLKGIETRYPVFDAKLLEKVDPLVPGTEVIVVLKEWRPKEGDPKTIVANITKKVKAAIEDDEIPF
jgi:hypothetical protein